MKTRFNLGETVAAQRRIIFIAEWASERQEVDLGDIGAADTFVLDYDGQNTSAITFAADMTTAITNALHALSNIDAGDILVEKDPSDQVYTVHLGGSLLSTHIALLAIESPTTFTPGGVTRLSLAAAPAEGLTFDAGEIQISKNGATEASAAGTVTEIGRGRYYYEATLAELDTRGFLSLVTVRDDIAVVFPTVEVVSDVLRSGTATGGTSSSIFLDGAASSTNDLYLPCDAHIVGGTGFGQGARHGVSYNGITKELVVTPEYEVTPDSTTQFELQSALSVMTESEINALIITIVQEYVAANPINVSVQGVAEASLVPRRSTP